PRICAGAAVFRGPPHDCRVEADQRRRRLMLGRLFASATVAHAHCDLYCGVYDPAQAKIEALSVVKTAKKYHESDDEVFRQRAVIIKEQRAEETKHHLMVLWADFFAPEHFAQFPNLHELFWKATHQAGEAKKS